jgi:hypothetical protein
MAKQDSAAIRSNAAMRRHKRAIRGVALLTQWVKPFNTVKAYVFKAINTVHSGQLRILGSIQLGHIEGQSIARDCFAQQVYV